MRASSGFSLVQRMTCWNGCDEGFVGVQPCATDDLLERVR